MKDTTILRTGIIGSAITADCCEPDFQKNNREGA